MKAYWPRGKKEKLAIFSTKIGSFKVRNLFYMKN